jgi:hypothetical protein
MTQPILAENVKGKGRHYRDPRNGELLPSVTNLLGALSKPALPRWAAKVVAEQAWALRGSLAELEEAEAIDLLKGSPWRSSTRAANRGDSIHDLLERRSLGKAGQALEGEAVAFESGVDAFLSDHDLEPWHTEVTLFGDGYAGTADFLGLFDGVPVMLDYKTGKGLYPEVGLQTAALAYCPIMVVDGEVKETPLVTEGVAVLIKPGGYEVKRIADLAACYRAFMALKAVWEWQHGDAVLAEWPDHRQGVMDVEIEGEPGALVRIAE